MIRWIRAHFDGKVIVPDEPVDLPVNTPLRIPLQEGSNGPGRLSSEMIEKRLRALSRLSARVPVPAPALESLHRENLYDERA